MEKGDHDRTPCRECGARFISPTEMYTANMSGRMCDMCHELLARSAKAYYAAPDARRLDAIAKTLDRREYLKGSHQ